MTEITLVEAVGQALAYEMAADPDVVVLGEDVGINGGVFRATAGLQERFGPDAQLERLVSSLRQEMDRDAREGLYAAIEQRLLERLPLVPLGLVPQTRPYRWFLVADSVRDFVDPVSGRVTYRTGPPLAWIRPPR